MDSKKGLWTLIGVIIFLLCMIFIANKCSENKYKHDNSIVNSKGEREYITKTEHVYHTDTVFQVKHIRIPIPTIDTVEKIVYADTNNCRRIYVYQDSLVDSNMVFYYKDFIQGTLRDKQMSYKLKVPTRIVDSIETKILIDPKFSLSAGGEVGLNILTPVLDFRYNKTTIGVGYNFLNKTPQLRLTYRLFQK